MHLWRTLSHLQLQYNTRNGRQGCCRACVKDGKGSGGGATSLGPHWGGAIEAERVCHLVEGVLHVA